MKSKKSGVAVSIWNLSLFSNSKDQLLKELNNILQNSRSTTYIFTPNPEQLVQASENNRFINVLSHSDYLLPDGWGVVWMWRILAKFGQNPPLSTRISGREIVAWFAEYSRNHPLKVLVIGGRNYAQQTFAGHTIQPVSQKIDASTSKKSGQWFWTEAYQQATKPSAEEESKVEQIFTELKPDIVLVAFGAPTQEFWIDEHRALLEANNVKIAMAVGGSLDYLLGNVPQCPDWLAEAGGEWLFRLVTQPWRLARQTRLLKFIALGMKEYFRQARNAQ